MTGPRVISPATPARARALPCPACPAQPGDRCDPAATPVFDGTHVARRLLAEKVPFEDWTMIGRTPR